MSMQFEPDKLEGWLWKMGQKGIKGFKKRWFQLSPTNANELHYFVNNSSASKGYIDLRLINSVSSENPPKRDTKGLYFYVHTTERTYTLIAATDKDHEYWLTKLEKLRNASYKLQQIQSLQRMLEAKNEEFIVLGQQIETERAQWAQEKNQLTQEIKRITDLSQQEIMKRDASIEEMKKDIETLITDMEKLEEQALELKEQQGGKNNKNKKEKEKENAKKEKEREKEEKETKKKGKK